MEKTIIIVSILMAMAVLAAPSVRPDPRRLPRGTCQPGTVLIGVLDRKPLCLDPRKKGLETISYDIVQFGAKFDLTATTKLAENLASASKTSIVPNKINPNFLVLLIANDTLVDLEKALTSLNIENASYGAKEFEQNVHDYRRGIVEGTLTFGYQHVVLLNRRGQSVYVVVIVQKTPELAVFIASNILDNMMYALGLSVGEQHHE